MLFDSHTHLNFQAYDEDREEVIKRCLDFPMSLVNIGAAFATSLKAVELAKNNQNFYAALGLHPIHVFDEEFKITDYQKLITANSEKVVAMGESGLDYYHFNEVEEKYGVDFAKMQAKQREIFIKHIQLAKDNNLALVVHGRNDQESKLNVYQDIFNVLVEQKVERAVIHCFGGSLEEAKKFVDKGFYLGFTGIITFDKTGVLESIIKIMPRDKILIETDAPYLTPVPNRGKRNEPVYVEHVAVKIAEILEMSKEEVIELTGNNAKNLFNLK
ncbi:TatD family hydrolase [Candidatus Nomurabacteria bacterium]|nr:TatD family hydrolase [Candidatus Nomurabacteria bacterium]